MQTRTEPMSSFELLSLPFFQNASSISRSSTDNQALLLETAAASLQSSITGSQETAAATLCFLSDSCSRLADAYERLSACTFAAHSLRQRSPCVPPDHVMRGCLVHSTSYASSAIGDDDVPYPTVCGGDFEVKLSPEFYGFNNTAACHHSAGQLDPALNNDQVSQGSIRASAHLSEIGTKRRRSSIEDDTLNTVAHTSQSSEVFTEGVYLQGHTCAPLIATACANQDFDWLPGDGVVS
jgi:hypothetical protein